jgi:hypothetical protein
MTLGRLARLVGAAILVLVANVAVSILYMVVYGHLPRSIRAPTSLLLAPVAIIDGLCYAFGVPGIYGKLIPVFMINLGFGLLACLAMARLWRRRANPTSTRLD